MGRHGTPVMASLWRTLRGPSLVNKESNLSELRGQLGNAVVSSSWGETFKRKKRQNSKYGLHYFKNQQKCMEDADAM